MKKSFRIEPGKSYAFYVKEGAISNKRMHIITIIDDNMIVWKYWVKSRRQWQYNIDHICLFEMYHAEGWLKI